MLVMRHNEIIILFPETDADRQRLMEDDDLAPQVGPRGMYFVAPAKDFDALFSRYGDEMAESVMRQFGPMPESLR